MTTVGGVDDIPRLRKGVGGASASSYYETSMHGSATPGGGGGGGATTPKTVAAPSTMAGVIVALLVVIMLLFLASFGMLIYVAVQSGRILDDVSNENGNGTCAGCASAADPLHLRTCTGTRPLNIFVMNEHGFAVTEPDPLYILAAALTAAGHNVVVFASLYSGPYASGAFVDAQPLCGVFSLVEGAVFAGACQCTPVCIEPMHPATLALAIPYVIASYDLAETWANGPDLIITGFGDLWTANGAFGPHSGSIGATLTSLGRFPGLSPAIAVSVPTEAETALAAVFMVNLTLSLQCAPYFASSGRLLPPTLGLSVQFPLGAPLGARMTRQGAVYHAGGDLFPTQSVNPARFIIQSVSQGGLNPLTSDSTFSEAIYFDDYPNSDALAVAEGYIAVTPVVPRFDAPACERSLVLNSLNAQSGSTAPVCQNCTVPMEPTMTPPPPPPPPSSSPPPPPVGRRRNTAAHHAESQTPPPPSSPPSHQRQHSAAAEAPTMSNEQRIDEIRRKWLAFMEKH
jgi:broad specificity polyphosphatase/5'/3'-nucleotidase SurE